MPIYEYRCDDCNRKASFLIGVVYNSKTDIVCPKCNSTNLTRIISKVSIKRSEEDMLESLADPSKIGDINDPKALKNWAKKLGREMGDEMGEDFDEELEKMEEEERKSKDEFSDDDS